MGLKPEINITPMGLVVGVGLIVGGLAVWRSLQAVKGAVGSVGDMVNGVLNMPAKVAESARQGGAAFKDMYEPNTVNRVNTPDVYTPVYNDPLVNDDGMDFRYF